MSDDDALPSGIVTFVFTDIEGSTRLLRRLGDRYPEVLERHFAIMRRAWAAHGGREIDGTGDSVMVAFRDASAALAACAAAQRGLAEEPWPPGGEVRVRMGMHAGLASPRGSRYLALAVHQAARVMSAAHGGQVLVSADAVALLSALREVAIVPVGRFRLRDFEEPVQLFALSEPASDQTFPAVRAVPADGHNLAAPPTSFLGRDAETVAVVAAAAPRRLVTLTGPGGVGKTRLAIEVGRRIVPDWDDGVWFVDLATVDDGSHVAAAVGEAVGVPTRGGDRWTEVLDHLRRRAALLIIDNCEHLGRPVSESVSDILVACPSTGVIATSREPLGIRGEIVRRVGTLTLPHAGADAATATASPAVALFLDRARAVRAEFALDDANAATVVEICRKLDGLPLALELAAARLAELSPDDVLRGLRDRFRLLRSRHPAAPERQRTMEHVLDWSYRLLEEPGQMCLRRLGVFGGSFTLDAATAAVRDASEDRDTVPELVWSLVDRSLVVADLTANQTRYRLLESVRDFAVARLDEHGETAATAAQLTGWYLDRIGPAHRHRQGWIGDVGVELDNLRALIPLVADGIPEQAQALALGVARYLAMVHSTHDGIDEVLHDLQRLRAPTPTRVSLLAALADLYLAVGDVPSAKGALAEAEALHAEVGAAPPWDDAALPRARAELANRSGDVASAVDVARHALDGKLSTEAQGRMWCQLGIALGALGDLDGAEDAFGHELAAWEVLGDDWLQAASTGNLAEVALRRGDVRVAARHQLRCLDTALQFGSQVNVAFSLIVAARISADDGAWETATILHGRADAMLDASGVALYDDDRRASEVMLDAARRGLGESAFVSARAEGLGLDVPSAAALAERVLGDAADR